MVERKIASLGIVLSLAVIMLSIWCVVTSRPILVLTKNSVVNTVACPENTEKKFAQADVVMTGSVFMVVPDQQLARVIITPEKVYKGVLNQATVSVMARDEDPVQLDLAGAIPTLHFQTGQPPYLLFLHDRDDGTYTTSVCEGSRLLGVGLTDEERRALQGAVSI